MRDWILKYRHSIFLVGLLFFFFLPESVARIFHVELRFPLLILILTLTSIPLIHYSKKKNIYEILLVVILFILITFWANFQETKELAYASIMLLFFYFSYISYYLFVDVFTSKQVSLPIIIGSFSGYFLIGVLFFFMFLMADIGYPDTLNIDNSIHEGLEKTFYFSFITLTSVGYGDYLPTSTLGQKFAILEALIGQFYIASVIAVIVGKFIAQDSAKISMTEED